MVISKKGIVATSQTLASQAGAMVLARGGSAIDAAIAANAALTVVEPMSDGIGGDLFLIYREAKTGKLYGLNASGPAPAGLSIEYLKRKNYTSMPGSGIDSVSVPGCVDGWAQAHRRFGKLPWAEILQPAIHYAEHGFPLTEIIQDHWRGSVGKLSVDDYSRKTFLREGRAPEVGEIVRNADLAKALRTLATVGPRAFYEGAIAKAIVATSRREGGVIEPGDLANFRSEWVEPISTTYRGWKVYELPPNSQGMAALEMLNIMERFDLHHLNALGPEAFHYKMEAQKLAYMDLQRFLADPRESKIPLSGLISKAYAAERAKLISPGKALCEAPPGNPALAGSGDTVYLAAIDSEGNIASLIQSVYLSFGSGVAVEGYGFHLHNRAALFVMDPSHPNALKPGKRPFHTIIPGYMEKDGMHIGFGIMGGLNQAQAHAQFVSYIADHGMNIQAALEAPRFSKQNFGGCDTKVEGRLSDEVLTLLRNRGHSIDVLAPFSGYMGGGQVVMLDAKNKVHYAASDPRKDGAAVPEPESWWSKKQ